MIIILLTHVEERGHLTKVLSTKLSIEHYDSIRKIARKLFEKRIIKAPTISELIRVKVPRNRKSYIRIYSPL